MKNLTLTQAVEILNKHNHNGLDDWQVAVFGNTQYAESANSNQGHRKFRAIAIATAYLQEEKIQAIMEWLVKQQESINKGQGGIDNTSDFWSGSAEAYALSLIEVKSHFPEIVERYQREERKQ